MNEKECTRERREEVRERVHARKRERERKKKERKRREREKNYLILTFCQPHRATSRRRQK